MIKPASFSDLPYALQESLLWEFSLDYDGYESSKAEAVHDVLCNYPYAGSRNDKPQCFQPATCGTPTQGPLSQELK